MTKIMRVWAAAPVAITAMAMFASPSFAARPEPLRSGTITGWGITWVVRPSNRAVDCQGSEWSWNLQGLVAPPAAIAVGNPECSAWLKSGCNRALAGRNPAVTASIVDISDLADGTTPRVFNWRQLDGGHGGGGVVVQLWRWDCTEINGSKWRSGHVAADAPWTNAGRFSRTFWIPSSARWMTVTMNDTVRGVAWSLR